LLTSNFRQPDQSPRTAAFDVAHSKSNGRSARYALAALATLQLCGCTAWSPPASPGLRRGDQATQEAIRAAAKDPFPSAAQMGISQAKS
jgi:hypothetical protein